MTSRILIIMTNATPFWILACITFLEVTTLWGKKGRQPWYSYSVPSISVHVVNSCLTRSKLDLFIFDSPIFLFFLRLSNACPGSLTGVIEHDLSSLPGNSGYSGLSPIPSLDLLGRFKILKNFNLHIDSFFKENPKVNTFCERGIKTEVYRLYQI